jgi:D-serine dehydratase
VDYACQIFLIVRHRLVGKIRFNKQLKGQRSMNHQTTDQAGISPDRQRTISKEPQLWLNPELGRSIVRSDKAAIGMAEVRTAERRLAKFAPLIAALFPEVRDSAGIIESPLLSVPQIERHWHASGGQGRYWIKADHALPIAGSVKARGGIHEVLEFAESLAQKHGLLTSDASYLALADAPARALFSQYEIAVGSTGNLGLSIGIMASALGFRATVHMSADAKQWKKNRLRQCGVTVVEHQGDYAEAVDAGRRQAAADPFSYFVDDEHSVSLLLGYSVAAIRLQAQLQAQHIEVDQSHPLFVYLPCGVGGAPAGITFGLKLLFGDAVHCFFVEPTASACFLAQMQNLDCPGITVYDVGLNNQTDADGLAVPQASELAVALMRPLLSGIMTATDAMMFNDLYSVRCAEKIKIEPSAAAGFSGPKMLLQTKAGQEYLATHGLQHVMHQANHIVWTTGGLFVPGDEFDAFLERGRRPCNIQALCNAFLNGSCTFSLSI